jgi:hypothetical protein
MITFSIIISLVLLMNLNYFNFFSFIVLCAGLHSCQKAELLSTNNVATPVITTKGTSTFNTMLGVNAFEWNFLQNPSNASDGMQIYEPKMQLVTTFTGVRHYLDWGRIESQQGKYTFSPTHNGGWNLDAMYQRCKTDNIDVLICLKTCPDWLLQTYPADQRDAENVPMPYGSNKADPKSYVLQAKAGFQLAARYGSNKNVDASLVSVDNTPRWTNDPVNQVKTGLGLIKYIECDNERDKWWKGDKAHQTAEEYAANLSAFYDGHKGTLGKGVGVKNADPNMLVVMAGLATADPSYVSAMIDWCKKNRGYKSDGSVNLCFDIINYHLYSNNNKSNNGTATQGEAPELSEAGQTAASFVKLGTTYHLPVWVTEAGYDVNSQSPQRAIKIGNKDEVLTQADWITRTALLYARCGIQKLFFYELYDDNLSSSTQYASSGLVTGDLKRKPAADYILQVKNLIGNFTYQETINQNPLVDVYKSGNKTIYALVVPDQTGKVASYTLSVPATSKQVIIHKLAVGAGVTSDSSQQVSNGKITVSVSETPTFVELQ